MKVEKLIIDEYIEKLEEIEYERAFAYALVLTKQVKSFEELLESFSVDIFRFQEPNSIYKYKDFNKYKEYIRAVYKETLEIVSKKEVFNLVQRSEKIESFEEKNLFIFDIFTQMRIIYRELEESDMYTEQQAKIMSVKFDELDEFEGDTEGYCLTIEEGTIPKPEVVEEFFLRMKILKDNRWKQWLREVLLIIEN